VGPPGPARRARPTSSGRLRVPATGPRPTLGRVHVVRASSLVARAADPEQFTPGVWRTDAVDASVADHLRGNRFTYAPGARSAWHVHTDEQALVVLSGRGLIAWEGLDAVQALGTGDWVHVSPGVPHWHGAAPDSDLVHLAVTAGGRTVWLGPVEDDLHPPTGPAH
jgi:quercetin dioxygenase-like cupin family protein